MWHIIVRGQTNVTLTKKLLKMEKNAVIAREKQPKTMKITTTGKFVISVEKS